MTTELEMPKFHLKSVTAGDGCAVIVVTGEVDVYTVPQLRELVVDLIGRGFVHLIADLRDVDFLDSTGLGALVGTLRRVRTIDGSLMLVTKSERIMDIFKLTGLDNAFDIYPTIPKAVAASPQWTAAVSHEKPNPIFS
jgi:anti-sigma B factor antagonist